MLQTTGDCQRCTYGGCGLHETVQRETTRTHRATFPERKRTQSIHFEPNCIVSCLQNKKKTKCTFRLLVNNEPFSYEDNCWQVQSI